MTTEDPEKETPEAAIAAMLRENAPFSALSEAHRARIGEMSEVAFGGADVTFITQGDVGDFAYLVLDGTVRVEVETTAGPVVVATLGAGSLIGEIGAFAETKRTASIISTTEVALLKIERATIGTLLAESPEASAAIIGELGGRLQTLNGTIATLTQATRALALGEFEPDMLEVLRQEAGRFGHFADVFEEMAQEITNKRLLTQEMDTAAQIQRALLPAPIDPEDYGGGFEIVAEMTPAKDVGGDFFDYFMVDGETLAFAVGDVSGKGVPAALFMSVSRTALRTVARQGVSPAETLGQVNDFLCDGNREAMFVTLAFGRYNIATGEVLWSSGGHEEVFFTSEKGEVASGAPSGPALGIFSGAAFAQNSFVMPPGGTVVLATDGITEAFDSERRAFGRERLEREIARSASAPAAEQIRRIRKEVDAFAEGEPQADDLTCLALKFLGHRP